MKATNLIIDTDIGDDIDDAMAIAFALQCPEIKLVGVTTVFGNTKARAKIASSLLRTAGHAHIPVYAGCGKPLNESIDIDEVPCQYIAEDMDVLYVHNTHAIDFMIDEIMNSAEPVSILAIGPLTNLAVALMVEPKLKDKLDHIYMMGGAYYFHFVEWNIKCDPEAARIVFQSGIPISAIGLDVTKHCLMNKEQLSYIENDSSPIAQLLWKLIKQWQHDKGRTFPILHDALAVYGVFGEEHLKFERETIDVVLVGDYTRGLTFNLTDRKREEQLVQTAERAASLSPVRTAIEVDNESFIQFFLGRLLGK